jgi:hypothetical protein
MLPFFAIHFGLIARQRTRIRTSIGSPLYLASAGHPSAAHARSPLPPDTVHAPRTDMGLPTAPAGPPYAYRNMSSSNGAPTPPELRRTDSSDSQRSVPIVQRALTSHLIG